MSKKYVHQGKTCTFVAPYDVKSGEGFQVGSVFAVAQYDALSGAVVEGDLEGVWDLKKSTAGGSAFTQGTLLYWDNAAKVITKTASTNLKIGACVELDAADGDATGRARLNGSF